MSRNHVPILALALGVSVGFSFGARGTSAGGAAQNGGVTLAANPVRTAAQYPGEPSAAFAFESRVNVSAASDGLLLLTQKPGLIFSIR